MRFNILIFQNLPILNVVNHKKYSLLLILIYLRGLVILICNNDLEVHMSELSAHHKKGLLQPIYLWIIEQNKICIKVGIPIDINCFK